MDTLPYFLKLFYSNVLLHQIALTGNVCLVDQYHKGAYTLHTYHYIEIFDVHLTAQDFFKRVSVSVFDNKSVQFFMETDSPVYFDKVTEYFGPNHLYAPYEEQIKKKGLVLKHPYKYNFDDLSPKVYASVSKWRNGYKIFLVFGEFLIPQNTSD